MALLPVLPLPFLIIIAKSSVSVSACAPLLKSFSRGRSSSGQSLMVWYGAMDTSSIDVDKRSNTHSCGFVYHSARLTPTLARPALLDIRLPGGAGSPGGQADGRAA